MNKQQLDDILEKHKLWLPYGLDGARANLREANLRGANLRGAKLDDIKINEYTTANEYNMTLLRKAVNKLDRCPCKC